MKLGSVVMAYFHDGLSLVGVVVPPEKETPRDHQRILVLAPFQRAGTGSDVNVFGRAKVFQFPTYWEVESRNCAVVNVPVFVSAVEAVRRLERDAGLAQGGFERSLGFANAQAIMLMHFAWEFVQGTGENDYSRIHDVYLDRDDIKRLRVEIRYALGLDA